MLSGDLIDGVVALWPLISAILAAVLAQRYSAALLVAPLVYLTGQLAFSYAGLVPADIASVRHFGLEGWLGVAAILAAVETMTLAATCSARLTPTLSRPG